jgi:aminoglycoside phosphotransferase (APT) family kinase protein
MTIEADLNTRLLAALRIGTGLPELAYSGRPEPLTGGFAAELLAFAIADPPPGWPRQLVARIMPEAGVARKETIVQAAVAASGFPTPAVRLAGGPGSSLGRAFMVMDRAAGSPLFPGLHGAGTIAAGARQAGRLPHTLAASMAALHAIDPQPVRDQLRDLGDVPVTLCGLLCALRDAAERFRRDDLARAARWLIDHPRPPAPEVLCHGDLHPFNLIADGSRVTVLDWTACLLAPRAYDVAFTTCMLSEPPLSLPDPLRPLARSAGRILAARFTRHYADQARTALGSDDLRWHQAVVCLRVLVETASWADDGTIDMRAGHPWLTSGRAFAARLAAVTGVATRSR